MKNRDISIVCPLYRGQKYIHHILEMIEKNQTSLQNAGMKKELEVIFVNDYPQERISLPKNRFLNITIKLIEPEVNNGIHKSRALGLQLAEGEYVLFLDQDDKISADYLTSQLIHIKEKDAVLCNGYFQNNRMIYSSDSAQEEAVCFPKYLVKQNVIVSPGQILMKRSRIPNEWKQNILKENGSDDVLLWIIMLSQHMSFALNKEKIYWHMESGENASYSFEKMRYSILEFLDAVLKLDCLSIAEKTVFKEATEKRIYRYDCYIELQRKMCSLEQMENREKLKKYIGDRKVAVYGWGIFGREFWKWGKKAGIALCFGIDRAKASFPNPQVSLYEPEEDFPEVDLIVVTAVTDFEEIKSKLEKKSRAQIVLLSCLLDKTE